MGIFTVVAIVHAVTNNVHEVPKPGLLYMHAVAVVSSVSRACSC